MAADPKHPPGPPMTLGKKRTRRLFNGIIQMTYDSMMRFAENWIAAWNRRDVDAVLMHYADEAKFVSPVAYSIVGRAILFN
jgi:hypothetical protein